MSKKIKLFLGAYVDFLNAQNINCQALSKYLDKSKFEIITMLHPKGNDGNFRKEPGVRYIRQFRSMRKLGWLAFMWGIARADVAYLPKWEHDDFCRSWARLCGTKVFTTLEGILDDILLGKMTPERRRAYVEHFRLYEPWLYPITKYLKSHPGDNISYNFAPEVLYLGVESSHFKPGDRVRTSLQNIVFIGNDIVRKNIDDFFGAAKIHPDIEFHIVGGNKLATCTLQEYLQQHPMSNVTYHGRLNHAQLSELLLQMDLMYFPSHSEGFPKVHLETACAGVPTLCYADYGADEWITTGKNGYVVRTRNEAYAVIEHLKEHPEELQSLSCHAVELGRSFDWSILVKTWEDVIMRIYNSHK